MDPEQELGELLIGGNWDEARRIVEQNVVDYNYYYEMWRRTCLHHVCDTERYHEPPAPFDLVELIWKKDPWAIHRLDDKGRTPLFYAKESFSYTMFLLENGSDPNHYAYFWGSTGLTNIVSAHRIASQMHSDEFKRSMSIAMLYLKHGARYKDQKQGCHNCIVYLKRACDREEYSAFKHKIIAMHDLLVNTWDLLAIVQAKSLPRVDCALKLLPIELFKILKSFLIQ